MKSLAKQLLTDAKIRVPVLCGPMYPGSNAELVGAVSAAGGLGVVQPLSLTHLYGAASFREGLREVKKLTQGRPFGVNFTLLANKRYQKQVDEWIQVSVEENVEFFLTSLGKPDEVAKIAKRHNIKLYHDAHTPAIASKVADHVDGIICLNNAMGGQTGSFTAEAFIKDVPRSVKESLPLICAGGVGGESDLRRALDLGYAGAQVGTRFLATTECRVTDAYKRAIVDASINDVVLTNKMSGTDASVLRTNDVARGGLRVNPLFAWLLRTPATKTWMRTALLSRSLSRYKRAAFDDSVQYWQAGKGVASIHSIEPVDVIMRRFESAFEDWKNSHD